ncbi:Uma2 family endonuclease [Streptomyces sp. TRM 70361]|uniref:Uma2 family endonuclease n=1 Tax=Streptomyces sp. TRM 70361 TaxID=3116553 RepID=UPI002E7B07A6|nr:Uma2 family endonuclease [Streptomyces sp. TRM 70361]MEE1940395.1 Uma2 family endonuclease [Streptomyces sp. TRM 70361]
MTVEPAGRIEMTGSGETTLDGLFERLERMPVPEGYKVEIVEGSVFMTPQCWTHWDIIRKVLRQLEDRFGPDTEIISDVRIDSPGRLNGFAPDLAKIVDGAEPGAHGRFSAEDVELVVEVVSRSTAANDYGPKPAAYATAGVPAYLVVDPYTARCRLFTHPKDGGYRSELTTDFGEPGEDHRHLRRAHPGHGRLPPGLTGRARTDHHPGPRPLPAAQDSRRATSVAQ